MASIVDKQLGDGSKAYLVRFLDTDDIWKLADEIDEAYRSLAAGDSESVAR